jgi:hypothetical protein
LEAASESCPVEAIVEAQAETFVGTAFRNTGIFGAGSGGGASCARLTRFPSVST